MKKIIISASLILSSSLFAFNYNLYVGHINYNKSIKKYGNLSGLYINNYSNYKNIWMEFEPSILKIKYKDKSNYLLKQVSYAINYTIPISYNYLTSYLSWSGLWESQYKNKSFSKVLNIGVKDYNSLKGFVINPSFYYSQYSNFKVTQPTISLGYYFYPKLVDNDIGFFYLQGKYNYINISNGKNYNNFDLSITNYYQNLQTTINASIGKFEYKAEQKGFIVYNLEEEYKYQYGMNFLYKNDKAPSLGFSIIYNKMNNNTESLVTTVFLNGKF